MASTFDIKTARHQFPALHQSQVFMDNAGGSQILSSVVDSISSYLLERNVQLGASYPTSQISTSAYDAGVDAGAKYVNALTNEVVFGPSTTQLLRNLSISLTFPPDSEIILSAVDHEANVAPWLQLAAWRNLTVKWWVPTKSKTNPKLEPDDLKALLTPKTRLVCCTHTSNILGSITDIASLSHTIHTTVPGALFCVDAVAYAPHGPIDVQALGVDFYSFSWYKVYGPHIAMLFASTGAQKEMQSLGHYFKPSNTLEDKLGLAAASYEMVQSIPHVVDYLASHGAWSAIAQREEEIQEVLLAYLRSKPDVIQIYGEESSDRSLRVPVVSFVVKGHSSRGIIDEIESKSRFGCRSGHFYSKRLCEEVLGIENADDGVFRVSLLHYNTVEEVKGLVRLLDEVINSQKASSGLFGISMGQIDQSIDQLKGMSLSDHV